MNQLRVVKSLNGGIALVRGQYFSLYREVGSALCMAGPGASMEGIGKYLGRLGWAAVGTDGTAFKKGDVNVSVWDAFRPAANGVTADGSKRANIVLALSSLPTSLPFFAQLSKTSGGVPTLVVAPVDRALYELKGFRITKLEVVVTPGTCTAKDAEESRASARMLGTCLDLISRFALKYYVGRLVPGGSTFEGQKGYGKKTIQKLTGKLVPNFQEGFEQIVDGISEALMSTRGTAIHSKITYETEQRFLNAIPYLSVKKSTATLAGPLSRVIWPFRSSKEALASASEWNDGYYDTLVEQLDQILPNE